MTGEFTIISPLGTELELFDNKYFTLDDIEGQTEINNSISSSKISGADGETVNNVATDVRPLVFTLTINENIDVEEAKRYILQYVKICTTSQKGKAKCFISRLEALALWVFMIPYAPERSTIQVIAM